MSCEETPQGKSYRTYDWLSTNPVASSCGGALCSMYQVSKNYNKVTSWTFGSVESAFGYASSKARPLVDRVSGRLEGPMETIDSYVADELKKLEDKYPVVGKQPSEILNDGKKAVTGALYDGQEYLGKTRAGAIIGYGVDATLNITEGLVENLLPAQPDDVATEEEAEKKEPVVTVQKKKSWFGLRKRKIVVEEEEAEAEPPTIQPMQSRSERAYKISYAVYYRSLMKLHSLQQQVYISLKRLNTSLHLLQYAQSIASGVDKQRQNVAQALHDAEAKIRNYLTQKCKTEDHSSYDWLSDDDDNNWILKPDNKDIFQLAFDYAKTMSGKALENLRSLSSVTGYLPVRLQEGIDNAMQQAHDVYSTLKLNNVPAELPSFLLTQVLDIVETQIIFCKKLGNHISSFLLKARLGWVSTADDGSETSSQGVSEVRLDLDEEDDDDDEKEQEDK